MYIYIIYIYVHIYTYIYIYLYHSLYIYISISIYIYRYKYKYVSIAFSSWKDFLILFLSDFEWFLRGRIGLRELIDQVDGGGGNVMVPWNPRSRREQESAADEMALTMEKVVEKGGRKEGRSAGRGGGQNGERENTPLEAFWSGMPETWLCGERRFVNGDHENRQGEAMQASLM